VTSALFGDGGLDLGLTQVYGRPGLRPTLVIQGRIIAKGHHPRPAVVVGPEVTAWDITSAYAYPRYQPQRADGGRGQTSSVCPSRVQPVEDLIALPTLCYVRPARTKQSCNPLNAQLRDAGETALKRHVRSVVDNKAMHDAQDFDYFAYSRQTVLAESWAVCVNARGSYHGTV